MSDTDVGVDVEAEVDVDVEAEAIVESQVEVDTEVGVEVGYAPSPIRQRSKTKGLDAQYPLRPTKGDSPDRDAKVRDRTR